MKFSDETWIDIIIPYILLPLYLIIVLIGLSCSKAFGQPLTQTQLIQKIATAKVGDVLSRSGNAEVRKAPAGKLTAKIYGSPQWDANGQPLLKHSDLTGKITSRGRYVKYVPDVNTAKLAVRREKGNANVKEYWTVPDASFTKLVWTVDTDAWYVGFGDDTLIFYDSVNAELFRTPPPIAWDADKKEVIIKVSYIDKQLIYDILPDKYSYPLTIDPSTTINVLALSGKATNNAVDTYLNIRNATTAASVSAQEYMVGQQKSGTVYVVIRSFMSFPISDMASVDACSLYFKGDNDASTTDFTYHIYGARSYRSTLTTGDFSNFSNWAASGAYDSTKVLNIAKHSSAYTTNWDKFIFNSTGLDSVSAAINDTLWIAILSNRDVAVTEPTEQEYIGFSGGTPYISLTYTANAPTVTTQAATDVTKISFTGNGNITATGGDNCTRRGFCYMVGTSGDPTTANSVAYDDGDFGTGAYTKGITGLSSGTGYRVRAYAVNSAGTGYGATVQITTLSSLQTRSILSKDGVITPLMIDGVITPLRSP